MLAAALLLLVAPAVVAWQALLPDAPSPATGHAQVIAHGVAPMPAAQVAWRVVLDTADQPSDALPEERALGFALADRGAVGVFDAATGAETRLAAGEGLFVSGGASQTRWSLGTAAPSYYRLALVPAEQAADAGGDRLVLAGDPFAAPSGRAFDLDLVRDVLDPQEEMRLSDAGTPALVLATAGSIDVRAGNAAPVRVAAGQAGSFAGPLSIVGVGPRQSAFVAAVVGPEMPEPPAQPTGSIAVQVRACGDDVDLDAVAAAGFQAASLARCLPLALDPAPALVLADGQLLPPGSTDPATATYRWTSLLPSPFPFAAPALPRPYNDWVLLDDAGAVVAASDGSGVAATAATPGAFTVARGALDRTGTMYLFDTGSGSIAVRSFACPPGMTAQTLVVDSCDPASDLPTVQLADDKGIVATAAQPAADSPNVQVWQDLAFGDYRLSVTALPAGFDGVLAGGADYDPTAQAFTTTLDAANPEREVDLYLTRGADAGQLTVRLYDCPAGMTRDTLAGDFCPAGDPTALTLSSTEGSAPAPAVNGNAATWDGLTAGDYTLQVGGLGGAFADAVASSGSDLGGGAFAIQVAADQPADLAVYRLRPADAQPVDTDGDGLTDAGEAAIGTDPAVADTDGDGRADGDEVAADRRYQTDPTNPDTDGDGVNDGAELAAGTDPTDPASRPPA